MSELHALVRTTVARLAAQSAERTEAVRSSRNSSSTATPGGQSRALALGKRLRELESITASWERVLDLMSLAEAGLVGGGVLLSRTPEPRPAEKSPFVWRGDSSGMLYCASHWADIGSLADPVGVDTIPEDAECRMCEKRLRTP